MNPQPWINAWCFIFEVSCFIHTAWIRLCLDLNLTSTLIYLVLFCPVLSNVINSVGLLSLSLCLQHAGAAQQIGFWKLAYCVSPLTLASHKAERQYKFAKFFLFMYLSPKKPKIPIVFIVQFPYLLWCTVWDKLKEWLLREATSTNISVWVG